MHTPNHAALWATLTIAAFPITTLSLSWVGIDPFRSFVAGAAASLLVLLIEASIRRRWWFSDPAIQEHLAHPQFAMRLLVVLGMLVLIFQTTVLTGFLVTRSMDGNVVRWILARQCTGVPTDAAFFQLCRAIEKPALPTIGDTANLAIREAAATRFFGGGIVTCAVRPKVLECAPEECHIGAIVRCDQWQLGKLTRAPIAVSSVERPVVALLRPTENGTQRIDAWSDEPNTAAWQAVAGPIFDHAPTGWDVLESADMRIETFRRVLERLSSK